MHGRVIDQWTCAHCGRRDFPVQTLREDHEAREHQSAAPEDGEPLMARRIPGHRQTPNHRTCCSFGYALAVDLTPEDRDLAESLIGQVYDIELFEALTRPRREGDVEIPAVAPYVSEQGIGRHRRRQCCCFRDEPPTTTIRFVGKKSL